MASMNRVFLVGNLTRDPEIRYIPSGTAVADLGLAVSESFKSKTGEMQESTCYVDIVVWGRIAETCSEYLSKGSPVLVEGRLQLDQWENQQGEKRSKLRVRADRVQFLGRPQKGAQQGDAPEPRAQESHAEEPEPEAQRDSDDVPF